MREEVRVECRRTDRVALLNAPMDLDAERTCRGMPSWEGAELVSCCPLSPTVLKVERYRLFLWLAQPGSRPMS
jgi:hypothetical protein